MGKQSIIDFHGKDVWGIGIIEGMIIFSFHSSSAQRSQQA
jgi:hypothetical protein